jgi:DNA-binding NtrC family response regulator
MPVQQKYKERCEKKLEIERAPSNESVLVVDDDDGVRKVLSSILSEKGYLVVAVNNGKQALNALEKEYFDVALVDVELPDIKGTELLRRLKEKQPRMIKIIITGFPTLENAIKAVNEGADGYILKPFDAEKLLKTIRKHLDEKTAEDIRARMEIEESNKFQEQFKKPKGSIFSRQR